MDKYSLEDRNDHRARWVNRWFIHMGAIIKWYIYIYSLKYKCYGKINSGTIVEAHAYLNYKNNSSKGNTLWEAECCLCAL